MNDPTSRMGLSIPMQGIGAIPALCCVLTIGLALLIYVALIPYENHDIENHLLPWLQHILDAGINQSLASDFYNYTPPYIYLLSIASHLHGLISELAIIKSVSITFVLVAAGLVFLLVRQITLAPRVAMFAAAGVLFLPTVILNGPYWGQSDIIHTSSLLAFMICVFARRRLAAVIFFGVAVAFKLLAIFLGPFLLFLLLRREIPWRYVLAIPGVYLIAVLPAAIAGRPIVDLMTIYAAQAGYYARLSMNAPNPYHVLQALAPMPYQAGTLIGCALAGMTGLGIAIYGARNLRFSKESYLLLALLSLALMPFLLPKMHDRYFFAADVFAYVMAFSVPRLWWAAFGFQASSLLACSMFLFNFNLGPYLGAAINSLLIIGLLLEIWRRHLEIGEAGTQKEKLTQPDK